MLYTTHQEDHTPARVNINKKNLINIFKIETYYKPKHLKVL